MRVSLQAGDGEEYNRNIVLVCLPVPARRSKETFNAESHFDFVALDHVDVEELPLPLNILFFLRIKAI